MVSHDISRSSRGSPNQVGHHGDEETRRRACTHHLKCTALSSKSSTQQMKWRVQPHGWGRRMNGRAVRQWANTQPSPHTCVCGKRIASSFFGGAWNIATSEQRKLLREKFTQPNSNKGGEWTGKRNKTPLIFFYTQLIGWLLLWRWLLMLKDWHQPWWYQGNLPWPACHPAWFVVKYKKNWIWWSKNKHSYDPPNLRQVKSSEALIWVSQQSRKVKQIWRWQVKKSRPASRYWNNSKGSLPIIECSSA